MRLAGPLGRHSIGGLRETLCKQTFNHMVSRELDRVFHALADPTRRAIIRTLADGPMSITKLAQPFNGVMSLAATSKHVRVLEAAHLVHRQVQGRSHVCSLNVGPLMVAEAWIGTYQRFWNERVDDLEEVLRMDDDKP